MLLGGGAGGFVRSSNGREEDLRGPKIARYLHDKFESHPVGVAVTVTSSRLTAGAYRTEHEYDDLPVQR